MLLYCRVLRTNRPESRDLWRHGGCVHGRPLATQVYNRQIYDLLSPATDRLGQRTSLKLRGTDHVYVTPRETLSCSRLLRPEPCSRHPGLWLQSYLGGFW